MLKVARSFNFQIDNVVSSFVVLFLDTFVYGQLTVTAVSKRKIFVVQEFVIAYTKEGKPNWSVLEYSMED